MAQSEFYDLQSTTIDGEKFDFSQLKGKKVIIVNVASECGFTPQYQGLQELHEAFKDRDLVILGFPCNDFGKQEPGSNEDIKEFCSANFHVTFQMMSKVKIKGDDTDEVYSWLMNKDENTVGSLAVTWNFFKFLIDENGHWVTGLPSSVEPLDERIIQWIETGKYN